MITDIESYLRFFDTVRRRTERDIAALPAAAATWRPPVASGEAGWSIGQIVAHIGGTRLYFASAYRGEGWLWAKTEIDPRSAHVAAVARRPRPTASRRCSRHAGGLADARIEMIDTPGRTLPAGVCS